MKNSLPFLLLALCVVGCSKFATNSSPTSNSSSTNATANAAPATPKQVVDLPATFGKTKDEIKKMISATPKSEDPWLEYDLPEAALTFMFEKGKSNYSSFRFKTVTLGDSSISGTQTADQLGAMAGIDIKGKTPVSKSSLGDTYEQSIGGKPVSMVFYNVGGSFSSIIITPKLN